MKQDICSMIKYPYYARSSFNKSKPERARLEQFSNIRYLTLRYYCKFSIGQVKLIFMAIVNYQDLYTLTKY